MYAALQLVCAILAMYGTIILLLAIMASLFFIKNVTESATTPIQSISVDVRRYVWVFVCPLLRDPGQSGLETSGQRAYC